MEQTGGAIDHRTDRRVHRADHVVAGDQRPQPVREMDDLGGGHAGEQILGAAGKADHLVRKHRAADQDVVVLDQQPVERDLDRLVEPPAGQLAHVVGGNLAQLHERGRIVPAMVEDPPVPHHALDHGPADVPGELLVAHRRVRAECDEEVQRPHAGSELALEGLEHERHRHGPGAVGNQHQHAPTVERQPRQSLLRQARDLSVREVALGDAVSDHGVVRAGSPMLHVHVRNAMRARWMMSRRSAPCFTATSAILESEVPDFCFS